MQMPTVFVVPPEEDRSPTWCYFDATHTGCPTPFADPSCYAHSTMPVIETSSVNDILMHTESLDPDNSVVAEHRTPVLPAPSSPSPKLLFNDSEIVEVVKVGRHPQPSEHVKNGLQVKSSKAMKARALKALSSLKNVRKKAARAPSREENYAHHASHPLPSDPSQFPQPPPLSRRRSAIFTQFFASSTLRARSSFSYHSSSPRGSESRPSCSEFGPPGPPLGAEEMDTHIVSSLPEMPFRNQDGRCASPAPSNKRRFSMMSLQRLFTSSSPNSSTDNLSSGSTTPNSLDTTGPLSTTYSEPDTPADDAKRCDLPAPGCSYDTHVGGKAATADASFEMRLDSLHFEALSFDVDRF